MNNGFRARSAGVLWLPLLLLGGCGTPPAKDFGGHWTSINRFQSSTTEIPLHPAYAFYASPMDETLRTMLQRWAADTGMELTYRLPADFTLFQPVTQIHTSSVQQAARELSDAYAAQGVVVDVSGNRLDAHPAASLGTDRSPPLSSHGNRSAVPSSGVRP